MAWFDHALCAFGPQGTGYTSTESTNEGTTPVVYPADFNDTSTARTQPLLGLFYDAPLASEDAHRVTR